VSAVKFQLEEKCKLGSTTDMWVLGQSITELYPDTLKTRTECMTAHLIECKDWSNLGLLARSGISGTVYINGLQIELLFNRCTVPGIPSKMGVNIGAR
jgi:hypothetical protein